MRVEFFGVRGTFPGLGRKESKFGANTPCARLTPANGATVIVDAGTGIRPLGDLLIAQRKHGSGPLRLTLLFTHFHLDHVLGLPFFAPLYIEDAEIDFYSWREPDDMREILGRLAAAPLFPVPFESTPAKKNFFRLSEDGSSLEGMTVTHCPLHHPQGCVAYRFEERGRSIVFATDTEHPAAGIDERLAGFARGANVLIYDAMYLPGEYVAERRGWGHSTWIEGTRLARAAGVHRLLLSHFNPDHLDRVIRAMRRAARREFHGTEAAAQGMIVKL